MKMRNYFLVFFLSTGTFFLSKAQIIDPDTTEKAEIDRFSAEAGNLFVRNDMNMLPGSNEPINFDQEPFVTKGLGPNGELVAYYNFDVQPTEPAPIYVLFREGEEMPVQDQLNIINVIPGDAGYNDFWRVFKVTVPNDYTANTVTSAEEISMREYPMEATDILVNCPVVPEGSTAKYRLNGEDPGLTMGWYKNELVFYFNFSEKQLMLTESDMVPLSPIYVTFNINPPDGGPPSGFVTEELTGRTHNVIATLPEDEEYSPLWFVNVYDNSDFENVNNLTSALSANILATGVANVNCPVAAFFANVDRFSEEAGELFVRNSENGLPGPDEPIDFDQGPFITHGLGPQGEFVSYYNFDVQPTIPAPIYVLFKEGEPEPVEDQHNIIDVVPGDVGYNDFWRVFKVNVPSDYVANTASSAEDISMAGYTMEQTDIIVNCPVVPEGSSALLRYNEAESPELTTGWYKNMIVYYFNFSEKMLTADGSGMVPLSPIFVTFNINPGEPDGGPPSGFVMEPGGRTHNVVATLPGDETYSPLWLVNIYNNADFDDVSDLVSAQSANILVTGAANVNCPIVSVEASTSVKNSNSEIPGRYSLSQNYPNPFNPATNINFSIADNGQVSLVIYNSLGELVAEIINEILPAGNYSLNFNASGLPSGIYFYELSSGVFNQTKKMLLIK